MPRVPFHSIFQPPACLDRRVWVRQEISNHESHHIARLGSNSKISQETSMACPEHITSYCPSKFPLCAPSHTPVSNSIPSHPLPHAHPITRINHPPSLLPLAPPLLHITHGLYQAALGGHIGHTSLVFKAGSNSWVQSWIQSCIQSCAGVKKRF